MGSLECPGLERKLGGCVRKRWKAAMQSRLEEAAGPYGLLGPEALNEAVELFTCTTQTQDIVETCHLVGLLHWHRGLAFGDERSIPEARTASALLMLVGLAEPTLPLPEPLQRTAGTLSEAGAQVGWEELLQALALLLEKGADAHTARLAIRAGHNAIADIKQDPQRLSFPLRFLSIAWHRLFEYTGDRAALEQAIMHARKAVAQADAESMELTAALQNLANSLRVTFESTGDVQHLREAVDTGRQAAQTALETDGNRYMTLIGLADSLRTLYGQTTEGPLLDEALQLSIDALDAAPDPDQPPSALLLNSVIILRYQFERTGDSAVLNEAIAMARRSVEAAPLGTPTRQIALYNLGQMLNVLFGRTGDQTALEEAIDAVDAVVRTTPADHPDGPLYRSTLVAMLHGHFRRTGDADALDEAIRRGGEAVEATPQDHPHRWMYLVNLAVALKAKAEYMDDLDALRRVITIERQVAGLLPGTGRDQASAMTNLGNSLRLYYHHTRDTSALEEAISLCRAAVAETADDHPFRAQCEVNLALSLSDYGLVTGVNRCVEEAIGLLEIAASRTSAVTAVRVSAAREWGELARTLGQPEQAARGFALAVRLLPRLAARSLVHTDATRWMADYSQLASDAAACALDVGRPDQAVELLEMGRGVLLAQALESRTDLTDLRERAPELADRFDYLCARLDSGATNGPGLGAGTEVSEGVDDPDLRRLLAQELEALITRVRALPGLEQFLLPPQAAHLIAEAHSGPIVVVNVSRYRSDALILTSDGIQVCELPEVDYDDVHDRLSDMHHLLSQVNSSANARREAERVMAEDTLPWLWGDVTEPVLARLGLTKPLGKDGAPRMWWIPCGPLAYFPIHAAGHHLERSPEGRPRRAVMDRVASSYTPTVRALSHARAQRTRQKATSGGSPLPRVLAVAMPHTPGAGELPGSKSELEHLARLFPAVECLIDEDATRQAVLSRLAAHPWAHFACHAGADPDDPYQSRLVVHDHATEPLTALDVSQLRLESSELAYLSACSTAVTRTDLADEALHIVTAFQLAGFPHVVGTLWEINDVIAPEITAHIYAQLMSVGFDPDHTGTCVHRATRLIRDRYPNFPTLWAAHIHMGA